MKTFRLRKLLVEYLSDGEYDTDEICEYINKRTKHGTTSHVLGNVLSKDPRFKKVGTKTKTCTAKTRYYDTVSHTYTITVWGLEDNI